MRKVAIYLRVSTNRQDMEGYSIPLQRERLIAYCKAKGWVVAGVFVDPGHSGSTLERPGITQLIDGVKAGSFDVVLVYKLDRLSRSQKDTLTLIEDIFMANEVDFVSMQESFDTSTIYGRAMVGILSVFAQMERETIVERTLMGRSGRAEEGLWHGGGTEPIGYRYIDGELVVDPGEAQQVREVYELYAAGHSVTEITRQMEGYETKHGDWSHTSTVGNVLDNPLYAGVVHFDGVAAPGRHTAIIPQEVDQRVKSKRRRLKRADSALESDFLLTGVIYCSGCGGRYFPNRRPNGRVVYSCHSRAKKNRKMIKDPNCTAPHIPVDKLDAMVEAEVLALSADPSKVQEIIKKRATEDGDSAIGKTSNSRSEAIRQLDAEINRLMDLLQHDSLSDVGDIAEKIQAVHKERMSLLPLSQKAESKEYDLEGFRALLHEVSFSWSSSDLRGRRSFLLQLLDGVHIDGSGLRIDWSL